MKTLICPTCGCSLVRLGIPKAKASTSTYKGETLYFCCDGCTNLFQANPDKYLEQTDDLIACPTCLAEKPKQWATQLTVEGQDVYFCHCPHCMDLYKKDPQFYSNRLEGNIPNTSVMGHEGCCIAPD
ncbi:MAG: YHS domain-containing protein [Flavobacteriaceae bacterium]|nr:YHS domain-containing protein [Flavobacteriaceae bacterium]